MSLLFCRGENGPNCMSMRALPGEPDRSLFRFVLDTDIKGWIPHKVIDAALSGAVLDYLEALRRHADRMTKSGAVADFMAREEGHAYASLNVTNANVSSAEIAA